MFYHRSVGLVKQCSRYWYRCYRGEADERGPDDGEAGQQRGSPAPPDSGAEQIPPPPWQRLPDRQARRRREPISRDAIVAAAVRLLDREGLAALSMRRLADELGAGAASLYWHVGSKDGLLDLVLDEIIGEQQVPDPDPPRWREQLKEVARASAPRQPAPPVRGAHLDRPHPDGAERAAVTPSACWRSCGRAGCRRGWPCRATCCSSPR